jgi:hypothetical protein
MIHMTAVDSAIRSNHPRNILFSDSYLNYHNQTNQTLITLQYRGPQRIRAN